ncbi:TIGR01777 family oxidoreductase [Sulfurospirillum sp. 1307]
MRIAICGISGFVGKNLSREFVNDGHEVVRIGREHFLDEEALYRALYKCDVVINLSGAPILKKWDEAYKHELYVSRIDTTKKLIRVIEKLQEKPKVFISPSAIGIYKENLVHDENSTEFGTNYLALLAKDWESEAKKVEKFGVRCVVFRLGVVLGKDGGIVDELKVLFKIGLGAVAGDGNQPFSWVHVDDVINVFKLAIRDENMSGVYNLVAPESVSNKTFMKIFGKVLSRPVFLNAPEVFLKLKYAEGAENLLKGSFVVSKRLEKMDYKFKFNNLYEALRDILK